MNKQVLLQQRHFGTEKPGLAATHWRRLTFGEFASRLEREFGVAATAASGLGSAGFSSRDRLEPSDIRWLCNQVGVPAEDFGIEA